MAPIEVNGGAAAEKPSKHNKLVIIGSGPAGREFSRTSLQSISVRGEGAECEARERHGDEQTSVRAYRSTSR